MKPTTFTISPQDFISGPYVDCPKGHKGAFGVVDVYGHHYVRRCKVCLHSESISLPSIKKAVIYLDQFILSNMMKAINPNVPTEHRAAEFAFYKRAFEKLDRLNKLQLITCPSSSTHSLETVVSTNAPQLRRMYKHLSGGNSFHDNDTIKRREIVNKFRETLGLPVRQITKQRILYGDPDEWHSRYIIDVDMSGNYPADLPQKIREEREQASELLRPVFHRWQQQTGKKFNYWFEEELNAQGPSVYKAAFQHFEKRTTQDPSTLDIGDLLPSTQELIVADMSHLLDEAKVPKDKRAKTIRSFFNGDAFKAIPCARSEAMLYAALARKAAYGQKNPPSRGVFNDVSFITSLATYCDALFLDKEFHTLITEEPLKTELAFSNRVFSLNTKDAFLSYLDDLESKMPEGHRDLVDAVYGDWYNHPFVEMYDRE